MANDTNAYPIIGKASIKPSLNVFKVIIGLF